MTFIRLTNIGMSYRERHNIASIIITSVTTHFLTSFYIILVITNINRVVNANSYTFTCSDWHSFSYYVISYVIYTISKWLSVASESLLRARDHGNGPSYIRTIIQINFLRKNMFLYLLSLHSLPVYPGLQIHENPTPSSWPKHVPPVPHGKLRQAPSIKNNTQLEKNLSQHLLRVYGPNSVPTLCTRLHVDSI